MGNELKFLLSWKPNSRFWIISVRRASLLPWKYLLVEGKEFFWSWKVSKFLRADSFANARKVDVNELEPSETPKSKTDFLIFLTNNRFLAGTIYIRFLIYAKAVYEQKMKEIYFSTVAPKLRFWSIFPDRRSWIFNKIFRGQNREKIIFLWNSLGVKLIFFVVDPFSMEVFRGECNFM